MYYYMPVGKSIIKKLITNASMDMEKGNQCVLRVFTNMWNLIKETNITKQKQAHRHREESCDYQGKMGGRGPKKVNGIKRYKLPAIR